jgi:hypothetical protein
MCFIIAIASHFYKISNARMTIEMSDENGYSNAARHMEHCKCDAIHPQCEEYAMQFVKDEMMYI